MGIPYTLYVAINKNTDEIHWEIVLADPQLAQQYIGRGVAIVQHPGPPKRFSETKSAFQCTYCDMRPVCHEKAPAAINCRTCIHSAPLESGAWICTHYDKELTKEEQLAGCKSHTPLDMQC